MPAINTQSAQVFKKAIDNATTKAEVTAALTELKRAPDLSPSEKATLAQEARDGIASRRQGFGVDDAFVKFLESQGSPVSNKTSPTMARIGAAVANSAKALQALVDDVAKLAGAGKGGGATPGKFDAISEKLQKAFAPVAAQMEKLEGLAGEIAKGSDSTITKGDINAVSNQLEAAKAALQGTIQSLNPRNVRQSGERLEDTIATLLRGAEMAKNTKEIGQVLEQQVAVGKGGGVETPSPFGGGGGGAGLTTLEPNRAVLARTTMDDLKFAEGKLLKWHDTSAVSDHDVTLVRNTLSDIFELPRGRYLTLEKASGDSAIFGGHNLKGNVKDASGATVGKFTADLNTGTIDIDAVRVGKGG